MARPRLDTGLTPEEVERLRRRYPAPRVPRAVLVGLVAVVAVAGLGWLVWAAFVHSSPPVSGFVSAYTVRSDQLIDVTLTVDRPDPSVRVSCRVIAQAEDFQTVAEQIVEVPPRVERVVDVDVPLTTLRRATSASVHGCSSI